jgi:hypothetical protein
MSDEDVLRMPSEFGCSDRVDDRGDGTVFGALPHPWELLTWLQGAALIEK